MITVMGAPNTAEYQAGLALRGLILETWPQLHDSAHDHILLVSGAKCHGQRVRDIDLILLATFESGFTFTPFLPFSSPYREGELELPDSIVVESFCVAIEIKDHPVDRVRFEGTRVEVMYTSPNGIVEWHDASQQNEDQMHSLKNHLVAYNIRSPFITPIIWLRNVPNTDLPPRPHNILGGGATWELFINVINQNSRPRYRSQAWRLNSNYSEAESLKSVADLLAKQITPTALDRQRMERINQRIVDEQRLHEIVGQKLLILRGRGGAGKTVRLLQLAKHLYDEQAARILILTYNKALVADLRRLLTIMGIADAIAERSIQIQTVHSYFYSVLCALEVISQNEEDFLKDYEKLKTEALEMLDLGAVNENDIHRLKVNSREAFSWDHIFIDEAQDWPEDERAILFRLYPYKMFAVADGIDQLIRSQTPVDWRGELTHEQIKIVSLKKCLRMKAGLTRFIGEMAAELGLSGNEWIANEDVPGGRVIVLEKVEPLKDKGLFDQLIASNRQAGNEPVDMLFCVPPAMVKSDHGNAERAQSTVAATFESWGLKTWDGASPAIRSTYPIDVEQLRVVQYDSCRGLEGWVVFLFSLDEFYAYKRNQLNSPNANITSVRVQAARWLLIPVTRAMDTLVIHVSDRNSPVYAALKTAAERCPGFVEWRAP